MLKEFLKQLHDQNLKTWTWKVDVYGYVMICYEVLIGRVSFCGYILKVIGKELLMEKNHIGLII